LNSHKEAVAMVGDMINEQPVGIPNIVSAPSVADLESSIGRAIASFTGLAVAKRPDLSIA
jgi:hypothetical protein